MQISIWEHKKTGKVQTNINSTNVQYIQKKKKKNNDVQYISLP